MVKIFSRHREWDAPSADGDVSAADLAQAEMLLAQLGRPALLEELRGELDAVGAIAARIRIASASEPAAPRPGARKPQRAGRVLAVALGAFSLTTGAAFAGVLPDALQTMAHEAFQRVGVTIPEAAGARSDPQDGVPGSAAPGEQIPEAGSGKANGADTPSAGNGGSGPGQGGGSKTNNGTRNHGANGEGKNAHGQDTAAANGKGKGHVKTQGNPHGSPPAHGTGGQPPAQDGGKPADAGPKPGTGGGPQPATGPKPDGEPKGGGPKK